MEDTKKIEIINKVIDISENLISLFKSPESRFVGSKGICFWVREADNHYNPIVGDIFKHMKLKKNFSSDYVRNFIDDLISDTLKEGIGNVKNNPLSIDTFEDSFQEVVVYIPLDGIKMKVGLKLRKFTLEVDKLKLGKITLKKMTAPILNKLADELENLLRNNPYFRPDNIEKNIEQLRNDILKHKDKICAEFRMFAEEDIAIENAFKECEKSLDLLRFSSYFFYRRDHVSIGLEGEIKRFYHEIIVHKANFRGYKFEATLRGPYDEFEILPNRIERMKEIGVFEVSSILEKQISTDFEETLLLGIHWFVNSQTQNEIENQFLSLMISLEIFLTPKDGEPISNFIAEETSRILKSELEDRKELKIDIKRFYRKRSVIVHGRKENMPNSDDVEYLENITANLILWMIQKSKDFNKKEDLLNYLEDRRLEGS